MRLLFVFLLVIGCVLGQPDLSANYAYAVNLTSSMTNGDSATGTYFVLYYTVNEDDGSIKLAMVSNTSATSGYSAFGLSRNGTMSPSDVFIGWQHSNGTVFGGEFLIGANVMGSSNVCKSTGNAVCPYSDRNCTDRSTLRSVSSTGGYMIVEWTRRLAAANCNYSLPFTLDIPVNVIFAVGLTSAAAWPYNLLYHFSRSNVSAMVNSTGFPMVFYSASPPGPPVSPIYWAVPTGIVGALVLLSGMVAAILFFRGFSGNHSE